MTTANEINKILTAEGWLFGGGLEVVEISDGDEDDGLYIFHDDGDVSELFRAANNLSQRHSVRAAPRIFDTGVPALRIT